MLIIKTFSSVRGNMCDYFPRSHRSVKDAYCDFIILKNLETKGNVQWHSQYSSSVSLGVRLYKLLRDLHHCKNGSMTVSYSSPNTANIITPCPSTNMELRKIIPMYVAPISCL